MTRKKPWVRATTIAAGFLPALALAHPGHGEAASFIAGALHPVGGIDHLAGFVIVGMLAAHLRGKYLWPITAAFLGLLVAAWTSESDGWRYAAGFMFMGSGLIAAAVVATRAATRLLALATTAAGRRSPT